MMAAHPKNEAAAKEVLAYLGTATAGEIFSKTYPGNLAANSNADTSFYTPLDKKASELIAGTAKHRPVPRPRHQPGVRGERDGRRPRRLHQRPELHRLDPERCRGPEEGHLRLMTEATGEPALVQATSPGLPGDLRGGGGPMARATERARASRRHFSS